MKTCSVYVSMALVLTLFNSASAQLPDEIRKHFNDHLVGEWSWETIWGNQKIHGESNLAWDESGVAIRSTSTSVDSKGSLRTTEIHGWDAVSGEVVISGFDSRGSAWTGRWKRTNSNSTSDWVGKGIGTYDGKPWESPMKLHCGKDEWRYEDTTDGKPFITVGKREESRSSGEDSKSFHAYGTRFAGGTWVHTDSSGKKLQHAYSWALGGKFLTFEDQSAEKPELAVIGTDPITGVRTWWSFAANGEVSVGRVTMKGTSEGYFESDNGRTVGSFKERFVNRDRLENSIEGKIDGVTMTGPQIWERTHEKSSFSLASNPPNTIPPSLSVMARMPKFSSASGQLPTGEKYISVMVTNWILGGRFLRMSESITVENQSTANYMFILGIDPKTSQATGWEFDSDGSVGKFVMAQDGKSLKGSAQLSTREKLEYQGTLEFDSTGAFHYRATGKIGDAAAQPYHVTSRKMDAP